MLVELFYLLCCLIAVFGQNCPPYQTFWFEQQLDHFNPQDLRTFQERYLVYDGAFNKSMNTIFFYAGNEGPVDAFYNNTGFMFDIAPEFGMSSLVNLFNNNITYIYYMQERLFCLLSIDTMERHIHLGMTFQHKICSS